MFVMLFVFFVLAIATVSRGLPQETHRAYRPSIDNKCEQSMFPNCGIILPQLLISNGIKSTLGSAPWNVAVYKKIGNQFELICGGTLISTNLVVSAAHCFTTQIDPTPQSTSLFKIAAGKLERDISIKDNNYTQVLDVKSILVEQDYLGFEAFYAYDIAVVVLKTQVKMSKVVLPVCLDWENKYFIPDGMRGKVVGWGNTEYNTFSDVLLETNLPYIDRHECRNLYSNEFKAYVSKEKFCAGSATGSSVLAGDSGAGLTFLFNGSFMLTGVVSMKNGGSKDSVALFTDVRHYMQWICNIYVNHTHKTEIPKDPIYNKNKTANGFEVVETHNCATENGFICEDNSKCIHRTFVCDQEQDCDDGSDEDSKMCKTRTCNENEFSCKSSVGHCIPRNWVCDGYKSCVDGADEDIQMCKFRSCEDDEFTCKSKDQCIPIAENICSGTKECSDGSDEDPSMCKAKYCRENQFMCKDGSDFCIPRQRVCNGKYECFDGSDEEVTMCKTRFCKDNEFKCKDNSGRCISRYRVCSGKKECADGSDEDPHMCRTRSCKDNEFYCANRSGHCIPRDWVCDGNNECADNSDEDTNMCKTRHCKNNEFRCKHNSGQCVSRELVCDGTKECADGSDEDSTMCKKRTCERDEFSCKQKKGQCISKSLVCNRLSACADGSDEDSVLCKMRSCAKNEFKCEGSIGQCIHRKYVCDGTISCGDGSDEDPEMCKE